MKKKRGKREKSENFTLFSLIFLVVLGIILAINQIQIYELKHTMEESAGLTFAQTRTVQIHDTIPDYFDGVIR